MYRDLLAALAVAVLLTAAVVGTVQIQRPALTERERSAAAEAFAAAAALGEEPREGYIVRHGEFVLWTHPRADAGPPPAGAVARYHSDGRLVEVTHGR